MKAHNYYDAGVRPETIIEAMIHLEQAVIHICQIHRLACFTPEGSRHIDRMAGEVRDFKQGLWNSINRPQP